ncbi:hypothetical protein GGQ04_002105 [Salinibacter ruber]|uniref:hypothetical protein n=1 Tax=Salinibacter ruber TaxID=146919 RepID=UPI00216A1C6A|nr:hypothetical protein [Salinibacter ruber]MCS4046969.1 hypothetical protein [Salinibacter ruber]MCS4178838.1 hypothetical protein [Salinibacter ruber]
MSNDPSRQGPQEEGKPQGSKGGERRKPIKDTEQTPSQDTRGGETGEQDPRACTVTKPPKFGPDRPSEPHRAENKSDQYNRTENIVREARNINDLSLPANMSPFVTRDFKILVLQEYPILEKHQGHRTFFTYLLTTVFTDDDTDGIVIPYMTIARCYGKQALEKAKNGNITTGVILNIFQSQVVDEFRYYDAYSASAGKARTVERTGIDNSIFRAWEEQDLISEDLIDFVRLKPWTGKNSKNLRDELKEQSGEENSPHCEDATEWRNYLNGRSPNLFTRAVKENYGEAREVAASFDGRTKQNQALRHLNAMAEQPQPIYGFSDNTVRLKSLNPSLQTVDSDIRHVITQDWVELDLSSAQLAVAATEWEMTELRDFLANGGNIWDSLFGYLDLGYYAKGPLKKGLYSVVFGSPRFQIPENISDEAEEEGIDISSDTASKFLEHPIIEELLEERERRIEAIEENGGIRDDAYDRWISLEECTAQNPKLSLLAQVAQAREMWLLRPVLDLALEQKNDRKRHAWQVTLLQHDGFSVHFTRSREYHLDRIKEAVKQRAERHGYPTELEVEN